MWSSHCWHDMSPFTVVSHTQIGRQEGGSWGQTDILQTSHWTMLPKPQDSVGGTVPCQHKGLWYAITKSMGDPPLWQVHTNCKTNHTSRANAHTALTLQPLHTDKSCTVFDLNELWRSLHECSAFISADGSQTNPSLCWPEGYINASVLIIKNTWPFPNLSWQQTITRA